MKTYIYTILVSHMIKAELKKIWRSKILIVALIVLVIFNISKILSENKIASDRTDFNTKRTQLYSSVEGTWDMDKIKFVTDTYNKALSVVSQGNYSTEPNQPGTYTGYIFGDFSLFGEVREKMEYMYNYEKFINKVVERAENNIAFYEGYGNEYAKRANEKIVKTYSQRKIDAFYDTEGAYKFIKYDFSSMMVLLLMMLASGTIFTCEKTTEMRLILKSSKNGRTRLNFIKIVSGVISAELIFLLFRLTDVLTFCSRFHIRCFGNQIYSIQEFQNTPLSCTIGEYFIIDTGYKMLVILVMELLYLFISAVSVDEIISFCTAFAATILLILFCGDCNPLQLISSRELFSEFEVFDILKFPVMKYNVLLIVNLLYVATLVILILIHEKVFCRKHFKMKKKSVSEERSSSFDNRI